MGRLQQLLTTIVEKNASDLHMAPGSPPQFRIDGTLVPLSPDPLSAEEVKSICYEGLSPEQIVKFEKERELDLAIGIEGVARFRANLYWSKDEIAGAFRVIPFKIPTPETLGIPSAAIDLTNLPRGLVLVTGPTGSGKSTTLASLVGLINRTRHEHILTIEDPIEFVHEHKLSFISQREIGRDSHSFTDSLKRVLRQDPNVILIGEMRDSETIGAAITISETGHLVFATLHTNTAAQTINRIIDVFPAHQQPQVRTQLSFILQGILCQQLLPKIGGGRVAACELLIPNYAIRNLIREDKIHQIYSAMQVGQGNSGMLTLNQCLANLVKEKKITWDHAAARCTDMEEFKRMCAQTS